MFKTPEARSLFDDLSRTLPALMSVAAAATALNVGITQIYSEISAGLLESFSETGIRKRSITGRSVARRAAEGLDAALTSQVTIHTIAATKARAKTGKTSLAGRQGAAEGGVTGRGRPRRAARVPMSPFALPADAEPPDPPSRP